MRDACDAFRGVYDETNGGDGYVSLEVSPDLARDADGTVAEAHRLWAAGRSPEPDDQGARHGGRRRGGRQLIADGINVNVTLLFASRHMLA